MWLPNSSASPAFGAAGRLGLQIGDWFAFEYQNTPMGTATIHQTPVQPGLAALNTKESLDAGFVDYNSFLAMLTLVKVVDLGFGPSVDFLAVSNNTWNPITGTQNSSSSGVSFGLHGRLGINLGSFCIEADVHEVFTNTGNGTSLTGGLGAEFN
jgi:hypothetical protein